MNDKLAAKWTTFRLGSVCTKIGSGATPRGGSSVYLEQGDVALIRSQNIYNHGFQHEGLVYLTDRHADELSNVEVAVGDVLLNITGDSVARACQVDASILPARVNQHVAIIRPDPKKLCPRFLRYHLVSPEMQGKMLSLAGAGATRNALTKGMIEAFVIPAPADVREQQAIAHILGTLDDKIELNRRRCKTLEAMARAIFQSWFVDFDPVHHNARQQNTSSRRDTSSRRRQSSGASVDSVPMQDPSTSVDGSKTNIDGSKTDASDNGSQAFRLSPELAALFPDRFEDSPLGPIPAGWKVGTVGDVADNPRRGINADKIKPATPYIALEHMPRRSIALTDWTTADAIESNKFEFHQGEILFGKLRPYFHKVGIAPLDGVCSTDILVIVPKQPEWFGFCAEHLSSDAIIQHADRASTGTKMPRTNWNDLARFEVVIPPCEVAELFSKQFKPMINRIHQCIQESRTLTALRDTLLPKLISGELRVPDAERIVGRAT